MVPSLQERSQTFPPEGGATNIGDLFVLKRSNLLLFCISLRKNKLNRHCLHILVFLSAFAFTCGCGSGLKTDYAQLGLIDVTGQVKFDGQPLPDAYVKFEAEDGTYSFGKTDSGGYYKLWFNTEKTGIVPGEKTVRIRLSGAFGAEGGMLDGKGSGSGEGGSYEEENLNDGPEVEEIPDSYHSKSKLKVNVSSGSSRVNFDLAADGSTVAAVE